VNNSRILVLASILLGITAVPARADLVTDPGFESCTSAGSQPPGWSGTATCGVGGHSGDWEAFLGRIPTTLSQSITTTPGASYLFSFWLSTDGAPSGGISDFTASFGTDQVLDLTHSPGFRYRQEEFIVSATTGSTLIDFVGSSVLFWLVDDVSVSPVPEPSGLVLLAAGVFGIGLIRRRSDARNRRVPTG